MSFLILIILGAAFMAWKKRKPLKLVLSEDEARFCKERWWHCARLELQSWCVVALVTAALSATFGVPPAGFLVVGLIEAILISRIVLCLVVILASAAWVIGSAAAAIGHPLYTPEPITVAMMVCMSAIVARFLLWSSKFLARRRYGR